jgi:hypothetical protein
VQSAITSKKKICFLFSGIICLGVAALSLPLQSDTSPPAYLISLCFLRRCDISIAFAIKLALSFGQLLALVPDHWVQYTLASRPDAVIVAALHNCLGLQELILGEFVLTDIPPLECSPL